MSNWADDRLIGYLGDREGRKGGNYVVCVAPMVFEPGVERVGYIFEEPMAMEDAGRVSAVP